MKRRSFLQALLGTGVAATTGITIADTEPVKSTGSFTRSKPTASGGTGVNSLLSPMVSLDRRSRGFWVIESNGVHHLLPSNTNQLFK